jgi:hypothetical protein
MEAESEKTARQKALELNLDPLIYGSIAEIGAGQEVARHFFQAGGASDTVAKTLSAYDMHMSDAIYGADSSGRYVTRSRLDSMLDVELDLVLERVAASRPPGSTFFAFADTVAARSPRRKGECHGWMGIKFQHAPCSDASRIVLHVRMLDSSNRGQQEALGILGVNLIHAAFTHRADPGRLLDALMDGLTWGRIEVDHVDLSGPCFPGVDNVALNLRIVTSSLGPVVMFGPDGRPVLPADRVHAKDVLILRGTFRPFSNVHADMIREGLRTASSRLGEPEKDIVVFCEMNVARYLSEGLDEASDLRERVATITELGHDVMVTSHLRYFRLSEYFAGQSRRNIGFIVSVNDVRTLFDDRYYEGLEGGILEAMGKLFATNTALLVYPNLIAERVITVENAEVPDHLVHLYRHLLSNSRILPIPKDPADLVPFDPQALRDRIASGDGSWQDEVPGPVRDRILSKP